MKHLLNKILVLIFICTLPLFPATGAYFSSTKSLDLGSISSGIWSVNTRITNQRSSEGEYSPEFSKTKPYRINYIVDSEAYRGTVKLCYSHNLGEVKCSGFNSSNGSFLFNFPDGEGLYFFDTIAYEGENELETKEFNFINPTANFSIRYDTTPPTSVINLGSVPVFQGQNLLSYGNMSSMGGRWHSGGETASPEIVSNIDIDYQNISSPDNSPMLHMTGESWTYQVVSIPTQLTPDLSFWFRMLSLDSVDTDSFHVEIRDPVTQLLLDTILVTGNFENTGDNTSWISGDSDWRHIIAPLYRWAGQSVQIWFGVHDTGGLSTPHVLLDDIWLGSTSLHLSDTSEIVVESHDTGSGVAEGVTTPTLQPGDNNVDTSNTDLAENTDTNNPTHVLVLSPIVLNQINFNTGNTQSVEIYNNSDTAQPVSGFTLTNSSLQTLTVGSTTIAAHAKLSIPLSETFSLRATDDTVTLQEGDQTIDRTTYHGLGQIGESWVRTPDGIGTWSLITPQMSSHLTLRQSAHRLLLTIANIPVSFGDYSEDKINYSIIYTGNGFEKEVAGIIRPSDVASGKSDRELYLGTCSANVCTPENLQPQPKFILKIDGQINGNLLIGTTQEYIL